MTYNTIWKALSKRNYKSQSEKPQKTVPVCAMFTGISICKMADWYTQEQVFRTMLIKRYKTLQLQMGDALPQLTCVACAVRLESNQF